MAETRKRYPDGCPIGSAVLSGAGNLPVRYVIHAVAPRYREHDPRCADELAGAYRASLQLGLDYGCRSISLPSLGTGAYRYPLGDAATIALFVLKDFIDLVHEGTPCYEQVRFILFDQTTYNAFAVALRQYFPLPWLPDESSLDSAINYQSVQEVERYDARMRTIRNVDEENRLILDRIHLQPEQTVLEIGTGTGAFALAAAPLCRKVYAADISEPMLRFVQNRALQQQITNLETLHDGFLSFQLEPESVDIVLASLSLHHLNDVWKAEAVHRIANVLKPGGLFVLIDIFWEFQQGEFNEYIARLIPDSFDKNMLVPFYDHIKMENSTFCWIMEGILYRNGFDVVSKEQLNIPITYVCVKRKN